MATARGAQQPSSGASGSRARILRIGVLLGGKIVEERLIRERTAVTIGQSMKNTFSIPIEGLPLEFTLFALDEHRYYLRFLGKMDGRLSDGGGQVNTLDALKGRGAQQVGDYWQVPLGDNARGKLTLGDLTILFQFVAEPPRQPKPMLPASVRGTFADRFDPRLSVILGISILTHFAIVIIALIADVDTGNSMAERAYNLTFKQDTYQVDVDQPKPEVTDTGSAGSAAPEKKPDPKPTKADPKPAKQDDGGRTEKDNVAMQEELAAKFADELTGEGPDGKAEGDMSKRRPGADLGQQITDVKEGGHTVAIGGGSGRTSRNDGDPRLGTGNGLKTNGGTLESAGGPKAEKQPQGRISVSDKQTFDESTLTPDLVLSKIQSAYMAGLKRCYKEYLKKEASARGKVTLSLTVNETGRTVKGKASNFPADEVNDCISNLMGSWRFPIPKDKDGEPTEAAFAITLQLIPD